MCHKRTDIFSSRAGMQRGSGVDVYCRRAGHNGGAAVGDGQGLRPRYGYLQNQNLSDRNVSPHVARKHRGSAIDGRTTRNTCCTMIIRVRRRIESIFGWVKTVVGMRNSRDRGLDRVSPPFSSAAIAHSLVRMARLEVV